MNKKFEEFINETKQRLLAYEMDESAFSECYDDKDRQMMGRLNEVLYPNKQKVYLFKDCKEFNYEPIRSMVGGNYGRKEIQ